MWNTWKINVEILCIFGIIKELRRRRIPSDVRGALDSFPARRSKGEADLGMQNETVRTRFAPSPTGFMHVGNLRTALYEYLIAKSMGGQFVLRIEDTDQERLVEGAVDVIYRTLNQVGLKHDEGPDVGGDYGPYVQSKRKDLYKPYAEQLVREGKAYYCFCTKERLDALHEAQEGGGYDRHCRDLP